MENTQSTSKSPKLKLDFKDSKYATGRRKTSIAKVWLKKGTGNIQINDNHVSSEEIIRKFSVSTVSNQYYELLKNII